MSYRYSKEALVVVSELIEKGFALKRGEVLKHKRGISVELYADNVLISTDKRAVIVNFTRHKSINRILWLVDGYLALA